MAQSQHTPELSTWTQSLVFKGLEIGTRMTVVVLDSQRNLLVHSPIRLTSEIQQQLDQMGKVTYVVAPNKWHHLYLKAFKETYPQAQFFGAPGLEKKKPDFYFDRKITDEQNYPWNPHLEHLIIHGAPTYNEVVFYHPKSKSLILTDTALHICENSPVMTRLFFKLIGNFGRLGLSRLEKWLFIKNNELFNDSMKKVSEWNFDRIIMAHGNPIESGGKTRFLQAYL